MFGLGKIDYFVFALGAVSLLVWIIFYLKGKKYSEMFDAIQENDFPLKDIYGLGYAVLETFKYNYKSKNDRKLRQQLEILYGNKYCEYYLRVIHSQQVTFFLTVLVIAFSLYGFSDEILTVAVGVMFACVMYYYCGTMITKKITERSEALLHDFSEVVSKLALLTNAGMILREAWQEVAFGGEGVIYTEMQTAVNEMNNGVADVDAIYNFGTRCIIPEIKKFTSTIVQGITKGNNELAVMMQEQSKEVWQLKKQLVRREGEKAASKLLIPICIMFVGILVMIIVPIFTNLGV